MYVNCVNFRHSIGATPALSAMMSGTQTREYQKLHENFDKVVDYLGDILSAEILSDKLFSKKLITKGIRDKACLGILTNTEKIRVLIAAIHAQVEMKAANYHTFLTVLSAIVGTEGITKILKIEK